MSGDQAVPPEDVVVVMATGQALHVDTMYKGIQDGTHTWEIISDIPAGRITKLLVGKLPAKTTIVLGRDVEASE